MILDVNKLLQRNYDNLKSFERREIKKLLIKKRGKYCENCNVLLGKIIHHKDGNRSNNSYENLILLCNTCHHALHKKMRLPFLQTQGQPFYQKK